MLQVIDEPRSCGNCYYWHPVGDVGECRVRPPQLGPIGPNQRGVWPITGPRDWCGQSKDDTRRKVNTAVQEPTEEQASEPAQAIST